MMAVDLAGVPSSVLARFDGRFEELLSTVEKDRGLCGIDGSSLDSI